MNTISKKLVSIALMATTGVWMSGALLLVPVASAQSVADLQTQIAALLAQIQQLQAQLNAAQGVTSAYNYTRDLTVGKKGDDVTALQQLLISKGYLKIAAPTGYFGSLTKAAVSALQAAAGISPTAGYFGPKTRAYVNSLAVGAPTTPGVPSVPAPASGLAVSSASNNPAAGSLISSSASAAARVPVLAFNLTAGSAGAITVNEVRINKVGVLSDSSISGAYLTESGKVLAQYNSISSGVVVFSNLGWSIAAGQTKNVTLAIDPATALSAGNTVSFAVNAASNVSAVDYNNVAVTPSGVFPISGNTFTVTSVSNPSLASMTVASSSIGTTVTAGTNNNLVGAWNFTVSNSKVYLKTINFKVIGSATKSDIRNVILKVNGTQVGPTLASVGSDGTAYFDASAAPGTLNTGSNNIQVYADIAGSPSYNFQLEILNSYDIYATDSQYNVPISAQSSTGTQVTIATGSITVSQATNTPTGSIAASQSGVTVAKFTIYAGGEAVKVKWLGVGLNLVGGMTGGTSNIDGQFKNLSMVDDAGGQVGTTINTLSTSVTCTADSSGGIIFTNTSSTYRNCFGNSSSPINYIVPANTTRVLSLKVDVQSTVDITSVTGVLTGNANNLQGLSSSQTASSAAASGAALTLATSGLTLAANSALGTQTLSAGATSKRIGSYAFTASTAEGVTVNSLNVQARGAVWTNLKVLVGGTQFGTTQGTVASGTTYSFNGTPFTVPAGGTSYVDVYADILSSATGSISPASVLTGCSASGATSLTAISCSSTNGQAVTFAGQSTVTVALDSGSPAASQLVMGSSGNTLGIFRFTETSNVEDIKITDLNVFQQVTATTTKSAFGGLALYNGAVLLGTAGSATMAASSSNPGPGYYYQFHFATPVVVPQANSVSLTLKGDVASYTSSGATDNTTHIFKIATSTDTVNDTAQETVVAMGSTSNSTSVVTLSSATANTMTVLRSKLSVSATPLGNTSGRAKSSVDDLATINFAADSAGSVKLSSVTITFSGSAPSSTAFYNATSTATSCATCVVQLYDANSAVSYYPTASSSNSLSFDLGNYQISNGTSKSFTLRVNDTYTGAMNTAVSGVSQSLSVTVNAATDVKWADSILSDATTGLNLEAKVVPVQIQSVSYAAGT